MIRECDKSDNNLILQIINDAAVAYKGVIPEDCWSDPYMSLDYLLHEIEGGVRFWGCETDGELAGVMGIQKVQDVVLIRHAYVRRTDQGQGIGGRLLKFLCGRLYEIATTGESSLAMTDEDSASCPTITAQAGDEQGSAMTDWDCRVLVGTWTDATWAIGFYEKHGFHLVSQDEKNALLRKYWSIPDKQIETSAVLELKRSAE